MSKNIKANGVNHIAIATDSMKEQIKYFTTVLGMRLRALYWMHGLEGCWHGFLELNESSTIAFVFAPGNKDAKPEYGASHAGFTAGACAPGAMQHLALNVDTLEDLMNMRDRIRAHGVNVFGPLDHGFCHSIYFQGPEDLCLEVATFGDADYPIGAKDWVDPEVQALAGISDEELAEFVNPPEYVGQGGALPQPKYDPNGYHPVQPEEVVKAIIATPDEELIAQMSEPLPPSLMTRQDREAKLGSQ